MSGTKARTKTRTRGREREGTRERRKRGRSQDGYMPWTLRPVCTTDRDTHTAIHNSQFFQLFQAFHVFRVSQLAPSRSLSPIVAGRLSNVEAYGYSMLYRAPGFTCFREPVKKCIDCDAARPEVGRSSPVIMRRLALLGDKPYGMNAMNATR